MSLVIEPKAALSDCPSGQASRSLFSIMDPLENLLVLAYDVSKSQGQGWRESHYIVEVKGESGPPRNWRIRRVNYH